MWSNLCLFIKNKAKHDLKYRRHDMTMLINEIYEYNHRCKYHKLIVK